MDKVQTDFCLCELPSLEQLPGVDRRLFPLVPGALEEARVVERGPLSVYLGVARQLGEEDGRLRDEVAVDEGEDGEGRHDNGQGLPVYEGTQQVDSDQTQTSEGRLYLEQEKCFNVKI